jgi:hypothetical protein
MDSEKKPLALPEDFDPQVNLPGREENGQVFHATIPGMNLATLTGLPVSAHLG